MNRIVLPKSIIIFVIVMAVLAVCVVIIGTTNLGSVISNIIEPHVSVSISAFDQQPDGQRVQVEGYFHNRDEYWLLGHEYDCVNYFLSENAQEPYGDTVELCINVYETDDAIINAFDGHRVRINGYVNLGMGYSSVEKYLAIYQNEDFQSVP